MASPTSLKQTSRCVEDAAPYDTLIVTVFSEWQNNKNKQTLDCRAPLAVTFIFMLLLNFQNNPSVRTCGSATFLCTRKAESEMPLTLPPLCKGRGTATAVEGL